MSTTTRTEPALPKLRQMALADALALAGLPTAASTKVAGLADVPAAVAALRAADMAGEAARLVAFALPKREAVWWACMCARAVPAPVGPEDMKALELAEAWVFKPADETRRQAFAHAQAAEFGTPEAWAAVAAFWSGDSMAPLGQPVVPPTANLAGTAVAGSVALAAVRISPEKRNARLERFLDSAAEIAGGGSGRLAAEGT
jgi:hypothetical protein